MIDYITRIRDENEPAIRDLVEREFQRGADMAQSRRDLGQSRWDSVGCYFGESDLIAYVRQVGRFDAELGRDNIAVIVRRVIRSMARAGIIESCIGSAINGGERREWFLSDGPVG